MEMEGVSWFYDKSSNALVQNDMTMGGGARVEICFKLRDVI